jgi:hypothetical protein
MTEEKLGILSQRIHEFNQLFEDNEACIQELFRRYKVTLKCPDCRCTDVVRPHGDRRFRCRSCWNYHSALLNTPFERIRRLREGLLLLWLKENEVEFNTQDFHGFTRLNYSTVEKLERKLAIVLANNNSVCKQCNGTGKCAACAGTSAQKSAKKTAASTPTTTNQSPNLDFLGPVSENEKNALEHLNDEFRHFDILWSRTGLSVNQLNAALLTLEMRKMITRQAQYYKLI